MTSIPGQAFRLMAGGVEDFEDFAAFRVDLVYFIRVDIRQPEILSIECQASRARSWRFDHFENISHLRPGTGGKKRENEKADEKFFHRILHSWLGSII